VQKVPATILSRVQKFTLRKIATPELVGRLRQICDAESIEAEDAALEIVARRGEGSVRDALSILDQIVAFSGRSFSASDVGAVLGLSDDSFFARLVALIESGDHAGMLEALQEAADSGRDFKLLYRDLLHFVRGALLAAAGANVEGAAPAGNLSYSELLRIANLLMRDDDTVNRSEHQRLAVEIALLKAATFPRLRAVEEALSGAPAPAPKKAEVAAPKGSSPKGSVPKAATADASLDGFVERVKNARPLIGGYLSGAKSSRRDGDRITFTFDDPFSAESVGAAREELEKIAAEVFGTRISIEAAVGQAAAAAAPHSPAREDPVIQAFQKHLGGEIVDSRRSK